MEAYLTKLAVSESVDWGITEESGRLIFLPSDAECVAPAIDKRRGCHTRVGEETVNRTILSDTRGLVSKKHAKDTVLAGISRGNLFN